MRKNPFEPISEKDKRARDAEKKFIAEATQRISETAQDCMASESFKRYLEAFKKYEQEMITVMIRCTHADPVEDALFLRRILSKIEMGRRFIDNVETDAKRIVK
jgi:hypothetical protein